MTQPIRMHAVERIEGGLNSAGALRLAERNSHRDA